MLYYFLLSLAEAVLFFAIVASKKTFVFHGIKEFPWWTLGGTLAVLLVTWGINYFNMPTLAPWGFEGVWIETFFVALIAFGFAYLDYYIAEPGDYDKERARRKRRSELKRWSWAWFKEYRDWLRALPLVITLIAPVVAAVQSFEMFNSEKFVKRLPVVETIENVDSAKVNAADTAFNKTVAVIDVQKMRTVDFDLAKKVGGDVLGNSTGLASKVEVGNPTLQNLNGSFTINGGKKLVFDNDLFWVAPLEHKSWIKYFNNKTTPGYVLIDATNINNRYLVTKVNGHDLNLRYLESAVLSDDIERHIKSNGYLSTGLNDHCFEIDSTGTPYWVLSRYKQTIGFAGEESVGPITVNAETGEVKAYSIENAPSWIDRIQPADFIEEQVEQWGSLQKGWWNSTFLSKQEEVMEPTPGMTLVYSNGRSYWYTGIKSVAAKEGTNGFMLIDTRTKEAKFYKSPGFNEVQAMVIAEGQEVASAAGYKATYPVLYNVRGVPTYFMTYKDMSGNIQGYCFISSYSRDAVGCDKLKKEAVRKYQEALKALKNDKLIDSDVVGEELLGTIRGIALEDGTYYVLINEKPGFEFIGTSNNFPELKWSKVGNKVKLTFNIGEEKVVPMDSFDNVDFEI